MPPTPLQSSHTSYEERQWQIEVEDQILDARDRTVSARTKQYLEKGDGMKVEVEESQSLLCPEDSEADFRRIFEEGRNKQGHAIFETFSSEGPSEFLVVGRARCVRAATAVVANSSRTRLRAPSTLSVSHLASHAPT